MYNIDVNLEARDSVISNNEPSCIQAKVKNQNEPRQVMQVRDKTLKSRSFKIKLIWTFDTKFSTICNIA